MKNFVPLALAVGLAAIFADDRTRAQQQAVPRSKQAPVVRAYGMVLPEDIVEVGSPLGGTIKKLGVDPGNANKTIEHGSVVKAGTLLAQFDLAPYEAELTQAKANLLRARASFLLAQAKADLAVQELARIKKRVEAKATPEEDMAVAGAAVKVAQAGVHVEEAGIEQSMALLKQAELNLHYASIRSPIDGIVLDRRVNVGQVVGGGGNTPALFLIAKDMKKMNVWVSVREADIAQVAKGQTATFTVEAYPKDTFKGKVTQIRLNANVSKGDVLYTVIVETDNSDGKLLPYLTANVSIEVGKQ